METEYRVSEDARSWAQNTLRELGLRPGRRLIVVHPGASGPYRVWPPERYAELLERLRGIVDGILLCGSSFDQEVIDEISRHLMAPLPRLNPGASVDRLGAILEQAALVVSNDSGPRHLAVAVGRPSVAFMPRFQDREWKIYDDSRRSIVLQGSAPCSLCSEGVCQDRIPRGERFGSECIRMIEVDAALSAVKTMLGGSTAS
jgi:ADP-heptose:LPS heptosyltransferase